MTKYELREKKPYDVTATRACDAEPTEYFIKSLFDPISSCCLTNDLNHSAPWIRVSDFEKRGKTVGKVAKWDETDALRFDSAALEFET